MHKDDPSKKPELEGYTEDYPGSEYHNVGIFWGNIFSTIRLSMGDYVVTDLAQYLNSTDIYLFWLVWVIHMIITCVIFLNFIVAEACQSYNNVANNIEQFIE